MEDRPDRPDGRRTTRSDDQAAEQSNDNTDRLGLEMPAAAPGAGGLSSQIASILQNPDAASFAQLLNSSSRGEGNFGMAGLPPAAFDDPATTGRREMPSTQRFPPSRGGGDRLSPLSMLRLEMGFPLQNNPSLLQEAMMAASAQDTGRTIPFSPAWELNQRQFMNPLPPSDPLSLLRQELAASNAAANEASLSNALRRFASVDPVAYMNYVAQRPQLDVLQLRARNPEADSWARASDIEAFLARQNVLGGGAALPNAQAVPYNQLRYQDQVGRLGFPTIPLNQQLPAASYAQPLDRAQAARFLAGQRAGDLNELSFARSLLPFQQAPHGRTTWPEGKEEESRANRPTLPMAVDQKEDDAYLLDVPWEDLVRPSMFYLPEHRGMVSDLNIVALAQVKPCAISHEDRVGLHKTRELGFPGICCRHCGGAPGFGRYFPSSVTSLINGNICTPIIKHVYDECRLCPVAIRESLRKLERQDKTSPFHSRRGSRREFFTYVWNTIQSRQSECGDASRQGSSGDGPRSLASRDRPERIADPFLSDDSESNIPWDRILEGSNLVRMTDRHLVPDSIFASTAQTKPCQVTEGDRVGRCKDHKLGSMGLCCKHCGGKEGAYGRYFPSNLQTFAQVEVSKQIVKHITQKCDVCPNDIRLAILAMQQRELTLSNRRFPSRMVFFRRVWYRFHYEDNPEGGSGDEGSDTDRKPSARGPAVEPESIPWELLLRDSTLVSLDDRGLISDSQFAALAQMEKCELTEEDRIGYNKDRAVGFVGLRCRFCGGRPGFGRYFPNTVRNFEKTSARETIVSHVSLFCQSCPEEIRNALLGLQRIESSRDGSTTMKALVYGSGKLFFRRVWSKLHSDRADEEDQDTKPAGTRADLTGQGNPPDAAASAAFPAQEPSDEDSDESDVEHAGTMETSTLSRGSKRPTQLDPSGGAKRRKA
jgi:hypothetical protein